MYRLQKQFGEQIDFINLDVSDPSTKEARYGFGMRNRSHYVLIDADQNVVAQWFGPLNDAKMVTELDEALATLSN